MFCWLYIPVQSCKKNQLGAQFLINMFIALLYMFRATMCPSSEENTIPMRHLVFVTLYVWRSAQFFLNIFIALLYMFWATMCPSSGENTVLMRHLVFVTLYGWLSGENSALRTRQSSIQSDKYQVSHKYSIFSWWWAHSCPKHVQKSNKHIKKKIVHQVGSFYKIIRIW
jgi:hypothetical protein